MKKLFSIVLALVCAVGLLMGNDGTKQVVNAKEGTRAGGGNELSTSKTADDTGTNGEYDVNFALPSKQGTADTNADVVIVMDKSSVSDLAGLKAATTKFIDELEKKEKEGVNFKVGVVWFNFDVHNGTAGLIDLDSTSATTIKDAIKDGSGSGSNFYGGVLRAQQWLQADTAVSDNNKFVIVASDLAGYVLDDGAGNGMVRYHDGAAYGGNFEFDSKYGSMDLTGITASDIDNLINNKTLVNGSTAADNMLAITASAGWLQITGGPIGTTTATWADLMAATNPSAFESSIYYSGNVLKQMKAAGYNLVAVTQPYNKSANMKATAGAYQDWFDENIGSRYKANEVNVEDAFKDITAKVFDLLGKGTITDVISDDFDIKLTKGTLDDNLRVLTDGKTLTKVKLSDNSYGFGNLVNGKYDFVGTYDSTTKTVKWDINTKISRYKKVNLLFRVKYNKPIGVNDVLVPTNKSAKIDYMSSLDSEAGVTTYNKTYDYGASPMVLVRGTGPVTLTSHQLTVNYVYEDGSEASNSIIQTVEEGSNYSLTSPVINGYTPDKKIVAGKMGTSDLVFTVVYKKNTTVVTNKPVTNNKETSKAVVNTKDATNIALLLALLGLGAVGIVISKRNKIKG